MYKEYKGLDLPAIDKEITAFWEKNDIFRKSIDTRPADQPYVFYEGPPSANGLPGIHHMVGRTIKDLFCRFHTLQGKRVARKGGWDTHGLPIELAVEKELGITKDDIGKKISVAEYNQKCRETVMRYKDIWDDLTRKMGYWVDLDNPYITYENNYIESVWYLLKELYKKDLLYKGYTIQPYSPAAGTGLSSHELNMPNAYKEISDISAVAQFKVKDSDNTYLLAWTTTPWTLPSNVALAVGKNITYVKVRTLNRYTQEAATVILAKDRFSAYFSEQNPNLTPEDLKPNNKPIPYLEILEEMPGSALEGMEYEQLLSYVIPTGPAFKVLLGDFVTTEDGTGIVHIAPTFGADDMRVGKQYGIDGLMVKDEEGNPTPLVDRQGRFVKEVTDFAGRYVKDYGQVEERPVDADIVIKLKTENKLFVSEKYLHSYPHCWRTDRPVLYYPLDSWFVRASARKDRMFELNKTINWKPAATGEGRFGKWLENLQDWNLSRSRYWGVPLPIWRSKDGKQELVIGSLEELQQQIDKANSVLGLGQQVPADLHRPYIDDITLVTEDGTPMYRETDLIDVWFDSGAMPYAQWHYPFENKELFEKNFPADFIAEGVDQTRGWFYTLHAIATMVFDQVAFKNVVSNGLVLDKNGVKMSKRLGNVVNPFDTMSKYGADATRWYMIGNSDPWENLKFDIVGVEESRAKFFGKLYNTYAFFVLYANVDQFQIDEQNIIPVADRPELDRWILSKLQNLIKEATTAYQNYEATRAVRAIETFVDEHLSNWYVRQSRRRFWKGELTADKKAAYETLYECLMVVGQLASPVAPFFSEWLYQNLTEGIREAAKANQTPLAAESVHTSLLTQADEARIDTELEQRMDYAQRISSLALSLRKEQKIRVRQPLQKILLPILDSSFQEQVEQVKELIMAEVNVKEISYISDTTGLLVKKAKPNFKTLGKRLGKDMKAASDSILAFDQAAIAALEKTGTISIQAGDNTYDITPDDVEIVAEDIPGWLVANDGPLTVALDVQITPELEAEGMARELVNRIQTMRKSKNFTVTDRIRVRIESHSMIEPALASFSQYIQDETLATELTAVPGLQQGEQTEISNEQSLYIDVVLA